MSTAYDNALAELYRAPHDEFVAERKRLATELTSGGDKPAGTRLSKLRRPSVPAWAVNQLWWKARPAFEQLFEHAARLRDGDLDAANAHRAALSALRTRAQQLLSEAGHPVNEATLRRVSTTLSALAAAGGFGPDPAGALAYEREPPGFDAFGDTASFRSEKPAATVRAEPAAKAKKSGAKADEDEARERAEKKAEAERLEKEREKQRAETRAARKRLEASLRSAEDRVSEHERKVQQLKHDLAEAEAKLETDRNTLKVYRERLAELDDD